MIESEEDRDAVTPADEAEAAAQEAGAIGGTEADYVDDEGERADEAERAVAEGGGGESEGFEQSEDALERYASHEDPGGNPAADAFDEDEDGSVEPEYGEADDARSPEDDE